MNVAEYNRNAWNLQSLDGCRWSTPYPDERIETAKAGDWSVLLTPNKAVPADWFPRYPGLAGLRILALACGGGQQVPLFAAAGAEVISFDLSDIQLQKDEEVCARHGLPIQVIQGDMADLSPLADASIDLIFNPVSNAFAEDLSPIWRECHRVLKPGGRLLCGFTNPCFYLFDHAELEESGELRVAHRLPYADLHDMEEEALSEVLEAQMIIEHSHSWESQIGGQCAAGFAITGFCEDDWDAESTGLHGWFPLYAASCAVKWRG